MITRRFSLALVLLGIAAAGLGCSTKAEESALGEELPRGPAFQEGHAPAKSLIDATTLQNRVIGERCAFEQRCDQVGEGRPFADVVTCTSTIASEWKSQLAECGGIAPHVLDRCLAAMRARSCREPIADLQSLSGCSAQELCPR